MICLLFAFFELLTAKRWLRGETPQQHLCHSWGCRSKPIRGICSQSRGLSSKTSAPAVFCTQASLFSFAPGNRCRS